MNYFCSKFNHLQHQELNINVLVRSTDAVLQRSTNTSNVFKRTRTHRSSAFYERFVLIAYQNTPFQCILRTFCSYSILEHTVLVRFTNISYLQRTRTPLNNSGCNNHLYNYCTINLRIKNILFKRITLITHLGNR